MGLVLNNKLNILEIDNEDYLKKIKREFILQDSRYDRYNPVEIIKTETGEIKVIVTEEIEETDTIIRFEGEDKIIENKYQFIKDYLIPSFSISALKYYEEFKIKIDSNNNLKDEKILELFSKVETKIILLINKLDKSKLLNKSDNEELIKISNEFLDSINTFKLSKFPNKKINLNLSKGGVLILFYSLLEKGIIVGHSSSELFRLVENYFTFRDSKSNKDIISAYKALAEYIPNKTSKKSRKNTIKISNDLEEKLFILLDFIKNEFGEK